MEPETIVLVESCEDDVFFFKRALEHAGVEHPVEVVSSVPEAIAFLSGENYHRICAIVTELHLPGEDGFELLRWIHDEPRLEGLPVIVLTASMRQEDFDSANDLGANKVFAKTCNPEELNEVAEYIRELGWRRAGFDRDFHRAGRKENASELLAALAARLK